MISELIAYVHLGDRTAASRNQLCYELAMRAECCGLYLEVAVPRGAALGEVPQELDTFLIHSVGMCI